MTNLKMCYGESAHNFLLSLVVTTVVATINLSSAPFINQTIIITNKERLIIKLILFTSLLSIGGMPAFTGFSPNWFAIQSITANNVTPMAVLILTISLITLYYYLNICYSGFLILNAEPNWNLQPQNYLTSNFISALVLSTISLTGTLLCTTLTNVI